MVTVLMVDDEDVSLYVLGRLLGKAGFNVLTANDGVEALKVLESQSPDVVLSDIMMPRMGGPELLRRIREDHRLDGIPVILATSTPVKWLDPIEGAAGIIQKPFEFESLVSVINGVLPKKS